MNFEKIQSQLGLDAICLSLIDQDDKFIVQRIGKIEDEDIKSFDLTPHRLGCFSTNKVVSQQIKNDDTSIHYLAAPVVNKFNRPIGVLEFVKNTFFGSFNFEDEKVIQLMAYILSAQLKNHRPVISTSHFEHLNPRKIPDALLYGITKARNNTLEIIKSCLVNRSSALIVGDKSDREFIIQYLAEKYSSIMNVNELKIQDISKTKIESKACYSINIEDANAINLSSLASTIEKSPETTFLLHTSYHSWASSCDNYYQLNILNSFVPPLFERGNDLLEMAEHICEQNNKALSEEIKQEIRSGIVLNHIQDFQSFKNFVLNIESIESNNKLNKKLVADALFNQHNTNESFDTYCSNIDNYVNEFNSPLEQKQKIKKVA